MSKFKVGDKVRKVTGYPFVGTVCAAYESEEKCCVKHKDKWEHIFSDKQLVADHAEYQYLDLLKQIVEEGDFREGRNGGVYSIFGPRLAFDLQEGFPLLTTKKVHFRGVVGELLWFLAGSTNAKPLQEQGIKIWDQWCDEDGELGPIYGKQWRSWTGASFWEDGFLKSNVTDQITGVINSLKNDPYGRRHIVSAWNVGDLDKMALPPCHCFFQFYVRRDPVLFESYLDCQLYQRSADVPIGVPYNIASYALLTYLIAREVGMKPGKFIHTMGDAHIYANQISGVESQLIRAPMKFPEVFVNHSAKGIFDLQIDDIKLVGYESHPAIKMPVAA